MDALITLTGSLVLPYLVLSLFVMLIVEILSRGLHLRERILGDAIRRMIAGKNKQQVLSFFSHPLIKSLSIRENVRLSYIPARVFARAFVEQFGNTRNQQELANENPSISANGDPPTAIRSLSAGITSNEDLSNVQRWFIDVMDQASGIYRVRTLMMVAVVSTMIVLGTNFDAIEIANHAVHKSLVQKAFEAEVGEIAKRLYEDPKNQGIDEFDIDLAQRSAENRAERGMIFPIGWTIDRSSSWIEQIRQNPSAFLSKITGLVTSILALMIGAPFLFDLLNRYMVIRLTIKPFDSMP
jgi:hypothetical protein